ncbi:MAG: alanine racemase [Candidatus Dormibacteria bacterium]
MTAAAAIPLAGRRDLAKWADVDAAAIRHNVEVIRRVVGGGVAVMAMVKADGYGHGAALASAAALEGGASWLGVSSAEEALQLRAQGISAPILVVGWAPAAQLPALVAAGVDLAVWEPAQVAAAAAAAGDLPARLHLKVDSGMGRLGALPASVPDLIEAVERAGPAVQPVGAFTHFADAEADPDYTLTQDAVFLVAVGEMRRRWPRLLLHAANSAAALGLPDTRHDLVRCGLAVYGYAPEGVEGASELRPAMSFRARVTQVKTLRRGRSVGYGRTWIAERETRVAAIAAGYGDGVQRAQSNRGSVLVGGRRCPIIGRVSMDQLTADVSQVDGVQPGDEAVVFGRQGEAWLGADEVGAAAGTISYEVLCAVSARVPRLPAAGEGQPGP